MHNQLIPMHEGAVGPYKALVRERLPLAIVAELGKRGAVVARTLAGPQSHHAHSKRVNLEQAHPLAAI